MSNINIFFEFKKLDRFKADAKINSYNEIELISEIKSKFNIEYVNLDFFEELKEHKNQLTKGKCDFLSFNNIGEPTFKIYLFFKEIFGDFLAKNPLHLYLLKIGQM